MFQRLRRSIQRNIFGKDPSYHDPYDDPAEQFYGRIYLRYLFEKIDSEFRHQRIKILDLGCHTGRLSIPLARAGHQVTGIDSSRFHIKQAEQHARQEGVQCRFLKGDGFRLVRRMPEASFDLVLCTEVLYQCPEFPELMRSLLPLLRSGGLLATSHRTRFFYLSRAIREKDFETAQVIVNQSEGLLWDSYFNWQTPQELKNLYLELGLDPLLMRPIGIFTGNGGDGMAKLCDLGQMTGADREVFFDIEAQDSEEFAGTGRYLLVIGRKRGN
jgi:SAM-dependent methyltransferase